MNQLTFKVTPLIVALICVPALVGLAQEPDDAELQELLGQPAAYAPPSAPMSSTATGISNTFNPAISVLGLMLGAGGAERSTRFSLQEFELRFTSIIDPFLRADITIAFPGEGTAVEAENGEEAEPPVELEAAIITSTSVPQVTLQFGKYWLPFGKHNRLHTHQFPFITPPLVIEQTFGGEALNELALEAIPLLPTSFFSELNLVMFQGDNDDLFLFEERANPETGASETAAGPGKAKYLAHSKNLFELTDASTLEAGLSYLTGLNNAGSGAATTVIGLDLTYKWRPLFARGRSGAIVQFEWIDTTRETGEGDLRSSGYYLSGQWRFAEFWWGETRTGQFTADVSDGAGAVEEQDSGHLDLLVAWVPTVFSAFRVQVSQISTLGADPELFFFLQYSFSIGSHPAHTY